MTAAIGSNDDRTRGDVAVRGIGEQAQGHSRRHAVRARISERNPAARQVRAAATPMQQAEKRTALSALAICPTVLSAASGLARSPRLREAPSGAAMHRRPELMRHH
jgi:hypothetical protein